MVEQAHFRKSLLATSSQQAGGRLATSRVTAGKILLATSLQQASDRQGHCRVATSSQQVETQATGTNNQ